jgi:carbon-monoxide dehydrogenase large subunit
MNACATYTNGAVAAIVRVDVETGVVEVLDYLVTHDCGTVVNPVVVEGQIQGGAAQGIGGALLERVAYGDGGQPLSTSLMDYLLPTATDVPPIAVDHIESPAPNLPFGIKGAGEAGTIGPAAAVAAAVDDALAGLGAEPIDSTPITPPRLWRAIRAGTGPERGPER